MAYVDTLSIMKAQCILDKTYKLCKRDCSTCNKYTRFYRCYNGLSDYEKMYVDEKARHDFERMKETYLLDRARKNLKRNVLITTAVILMIVFVLFIIKRIKQNINNISASDVPSIYLDNDRIKNILWATHSHVADVNRDNKINCVDYAITFKLEWDKVYPAEDCEIVRNNNEEVNWHHLFVRCKVDSRWKCVEPQANNGKYYMTDYWSNRQYDYNLNIYGETDYWLAKGKHEDR